MDRLLYNILQNTRQESNEDDSVATGSSYQYFDWSKPSKEGWIAVPNPNPHLKMFSQVIPNLFREMFK